MNILLIAYDYGITASGVITRRVAEHLTMENNNVLVVAQTVSPHVTDTDNIKILQVPNRLKSNKLLSRILRKIEEAKFCYFYDRIWVRLATNTIKNVLKNFTPDIIYCRTTPVEACYVGDMIHKQFSIPILQHFSDPVPAPLEYLPESKRRDGIVKKIRGVLQSATIVSYGNEAMLNYVQKYTGVDLSGKAFVSPDMASGSEIQYMPILIGKKRIVTYFGNIYGGRNPQPLYEAIAQLNLEENDIELRVYSNLSSEVLKRYPFVKSMGYNNDTFKVLAEANVLVDLDGDDTEPVFISSKLKDYLLINRPILSITPESSPSSALLSKMKTVNVVRNDVEKIKQAVVSILDKTIEDSEYKERNGLIHYFSPKNVTSVIIEHIAEVQKSLSV